MILVQSDRERIVGGKDELRVSLPPIPVVVGLPKDEEEEQRGLLDTSDVYRCRGRRLVDHGLETKSERGF